MSYCTKADLLGLIPEETLVQLTDDAGAGIVNDTRVTDAIADADAEIDGYCGKRYTLPFSPVPALVKKMSKEIAVYNLYARRQGAPDHIAKLRDDDVELLKSVSKGTSTLGSDAPAEITGDTSDNTAEIEGATRIFTRDKMKGF